MEKMGKMTNKKGRSKEGTSTARVRKKSRITRGQTVGRFGCIWSISKHIHDRLFLCASIDFTTRLK